MSLKSKPFWAAKNIRPETFLIGNCFTKTLLGHWAIFEIAYLCVYKKKIRKFSLIYSLLLNPSLHRVCSCCIMPELPVSMWCIVPGLPVSISAAEGLKAVFTKNANLESSLISQISSYPHQEEDFTAFHYIIPTT